MFCFVSLLFAYVHANALSYTHSTVSFVVRFIVSRYWEVLHVAFSSVKILTLIHAVILYYATDVLIKAVITTTIII